jgi:hypothetical protein
MKTNDLEDRVINFSVSIIDRAHLYSGSSEKLNKVLDENNQLISIFVASIKTSKSNNSKIANR